MSIDWFRSWHGAPTDPKWLLIAKRSETQPGIVSAIVWALFDHASQNAEHRGNVDGFDTETYAAFSGFDEPVIKRVIDVLKEKNVIKDGRLSAWERRQTKREDNSTPRVHKHRNAMKRSVTHETSREDKEKSREDKKDDAVASRASLISPEAMDLAEKLLIIAGHDTKFWPPGWCGAPMRVQTWLSQGWQPEIIVAAVTGAAARKRGPPANSVQFFEGAIAEEVARQSAPLPNGEKFTVVSNARPKSGIIQAADNLIAKLAEFDGPARGGDGLRSDAGEDPPRLLSHG